MKHITSLLILAAALTVSASASHQLGEISPATIRLIERQVVMPARAEPLHAYDRYYKRTFLPGLGKSPGRPAIEGRFMLRKEFADHWRNESVPVEGIPGAFVATGEYLPSVADAGCAIVTVDFDVASARLVEIKEEGVDEPALAICNGVA